MNASNINYRNRLKRRVDISRQQQQLSQQSSYQQPSPSNVVLPLQSSDDHNDNDTSGNLKDVSLNEGASRDVQKEGRETATYVGFESRRGDGGKNNDGNSIDINYKSYEAIKPANNKSGMDGNVDSMGNDESEALKQRAKDIILKRSQRNTNAANNYSPAASPSQTGPPADNQSDESDNLDNSQAIPPKRNSNNVVAMINRYENRGGVAGPPPQQQSIRPPSFHQQHSYNSSSSSKSTPPSKTVLSPTIEHPYQPSSPVGRDEISTTTSVLTDEAMDDRTSMIRNVTHWERRMQLQRQQQSKDTETNALSSYPIASKPSLTNNDGEVLDLVSEAIAINVGRTSSSSIRSSKPSSSPVNADNVAMSTSSATPIQHSTTAKVVTPDDKQKHPPQPPPSSEEKELPPSPAQTDHSADAAAGMMFALSSGENSTRKMITNLVKKDKRKQMQKNGFVSSSLRGTTNGVATLSKNDRVSSISAPIISPSSKLGNNKSTTPPFQSRSYQQPNQLGLEQKLGRLTESQLASSSNISVNDTSRISVATSVVSAQPSVESECVRQNAEIMLAMEGQMMDFLVGGGGGVGAAAHDSGDGINNDENDDAHNNDGDFNDNRLPQQKMDNHFSTLFSVEERDENSDYADPPLISDSDIDSNSRSDNSYDSGYDSYEHGDGKEFMTMKQKRASMVRRKDKDLGTFFDHLSSFLGVRCAVDRDEDSDVFYMNNSQFNTSFSVDDFHQWQDDDGIIADSNTQKRAPSKHSSDSSCTESHTTMVRDNTAKQRDHLAYLTPTLDSGPAFQFARHDTSGEDVDDNDGCLPDPEEESGLKSDHFSTGRDPPRGIDPEEGEEVLHRNRFQRQISPKTNAELNPDHVKLSTRQRLKGSSLHWQSSNGIIFGEANSTQLSPVRNSEKAASVSDLPPFSANATILKEHFVESEQKLSPSNRRGAGGLQYIDEVEDEDESEFSAEEESEGPQYKYDQFVKDFRDVVPKDSTGNESEPVEELVIGSISEGEVVESSVRSNFKLSSVTQRREIEAALHRSMRQANFNRQRKFVLQNPKAEMMSSQLGGKTQQLPSPSDAQDQSGRKDTGIHPSPQNTHAQNPQPDVGAKTRLERKLQGLGAPAKLSGDSVGTSELGSLYSASVVSKTVVNRTNLPPTKSIPISSLGATPIGTEKLNKDFFDSSPLNPQPRSNKLAFFPPSIDEKSQLSDGFGPLKSNKFNHQSQHERMEQSSPIPPPAVNRYRQRIPLHPPQPMRNYTNNGHPPKKLIMKNPSEMRDGTRVQTQTLRLVGRGGPSPQPRSAPSMPSGKRFQAFPSAAKVVRSSPQPQRVIPVGKRMNQPLHKQVPGSDRRHIQGAHNAPNKTHTNNPAPSRGTMIRSLDEKLRSMDPPSSEPSFSEASQVSSSVFEAVEVGSFGVQHTLTSKWDKPKDVPYRGVSYISTYKGKEEQQQEQVLNRGGKLKHKMMAMTTKVSQKHKLSPLGRMKTKK